MSDHDEFLNARNWVLRGLRAEMAKRDSSRHGWVDAERFAVVRAANEWAMARGRSTVTVEQVEAIEHLAMGHVDYGPKLALYVAELVYGYR